MKIDFAIKTTIFFLSAIHERRHRGVKRNGSRPADMVSTHCSFCEHIFFLSQRRSEIFLISSLLFSYISLRRNFGAAKL